MYGDDTTTSGCCWRGVSGSTPVLWLGWVGLSYVKRWDSVLVGQGRVVVTLAVILLKEVATSSIIVLTICRLNPLTKFTVFG